MDSDSSDKSRNRLNIVTLYKSTAKIQLDRTRDCVCTQNDIDASDESRGRPQSSSLGTVFNSERKRSKVTEDDPDETDQFVEQTWNSGPTVCNPDEESSSREQCDVQAVNNNVDSVASSQLQEEVEGIDESSIQQTVTMVAFDECIDKLINRERNIKSNNDSDEASC